MIIAIISILIITFIVWLIKSKLKLKICPICVGVALTWLWMFVGMKFNLLLTANYQLIIAILMGETVVGSMSKLEQFIKIKFVLIWKTIYVVFGFIAVYSLFSDNWIIFIIAMIVVIVTTLILKISSKEKKQDSGQTKQLEKMMENCC